MTAPDSLWAVTAVAHPALRDVRPTCESCLALTEAAISHAAVTGSVGATYGEADHSVTVARAVTVVVRPGVLDAADIVLDVETLQEALGHALNRPAETSR